MPDPENIVLEGEWNLTYVLWIVSVLWGQGVCR